MSYYKIFATLFWLRYLRPARRTTVPDPEPTDTTYGGADTLQQMAWRVIGDGEELATTIRWRGLGDGHLF